jgi:hypothetical protein
MPDGLPAQGMFEPEMLWWPQRNLMSLPQPNPFVEQASLRPKKQCSCQPWRPKKKQMLPPALPQNK